MLSAVLTSRPTPGVVGKHADGGCCLGFGKRVYHNYEEDWAENCPLRHATKYFCRRGNIVFGENPLSAARQEVMEPNTSTVSDSNLPDFVR